MQNSTTPLKLNSTKHFYYILFTISLMGTILIVICTRWGASVSDDTFRYIAAARNLAHGHGLYWPTSEGAVPLTGYPPLLSILLAPFELVGINALDAMRFLNAIFFGFTIYLSGIFVQRVTQTRGFGILAACLTLSSRSLLVTYSAAMSEALFITLCMACIVATLSFFEHNKTRFLLFATGAAGLAFLTRYSGLSILLTLMIVVIFIDNKVESHHKRRITTGIASLGFIPIGLWIIRNYFLIGGATNRIPAWHPPSMGWFEMGMRTILLWVVPGRLLQGDVKTIFIGLLLAIIFVTIFIVFRYKVRRQKPLRRSVRNAIILLIIYILATMSVLIIARLCFDELVPLNDRILAPVHHVGIILLSILAWILYAHASRPTRVIVVVFCIFFALFYVYRAVPSIKYMYQEGYGYTSRGWHDSSLIDEIQLHPESSVYSNAATAIYFWTERVTDPLLPMESMRDRIESDCAIVVAFDAIDLGLYGWSQEGLAKILVGEHFADGWLYMHTNCVEKYD